MQTIVNFCCQICVKIYCKMFGIVTVISFQGVIEPTQGICLELWWISYPSHVHLKQEIVSSQYSRIRDRDVKIY